MVSVHYTWLKDISFRDDPVYLHEKQADDPRA